jgi:succinate dehydrogenase flavin-adding protein (antitoxin of CptAB toxin-antitoxin module)
MMNFGIIKSRIEHTLLESYKKGTFKENMKNFKKLVLENKNISKLYYLYDDLSSNKGLHSEIVNDYINESITIYENTLNKVTGNDINKIISWVGSPKINNNYEVIDNLFNTNILAIESRIQSKKMISETLKKKPNVIKESVNIPLSSMVNVANKTISNYIDSLNESEMAELTKLLSENDDKLEGEFNVIKENVVNKLTEMKNNESDKSTQTRIEETLNKVMSEKYDKLSYFKLKSLNENI